MNYRERLEAQLLAEHWLTEEQLAHSYTVQKRQGGKLNNILLELGYIDATQLAKIIAQQLKIPFVDLASYEFDSACTQLLSETYARRYKAIVLEQRADQLVVAMADPMDLFAYDELVKVLKTDLELVVVTEADLLSSIDMIYRRREEIIGFAEQLSDSLQASEAVLSDFDVDVGADDAPVVKLLQSLFTDAVTMNASDIHIEPDEHVLRIRQRIDGVLQESIMDEKRIVVALILRLKLMASLNIAEKRIPQDGRFSIQINKQRIDVRLSTMPVQFGEAVVMRLLNQSKGVLDYPTLGITEPMQRQLQRVVNNPFGMILVTGPTGSGKTTTLYSVLAQINDAEHKIITVEDPVEYRLPRINQVQVNEPIGLNFTTVLRSALRHDPDIIMIGEIRDEETATIALRAAMTGHLVLATLHTNDAVSSALRMISMGVDSFLVGSALTGILAQRLVRRICQNCIDTYTLTDQESLWFEKLLAKDLSTISFKQGRGCSHCNRTGFRGRIGVFELLEMNKAMIDALHDQDQKRYYQAVKDHTLFKPLGLSAAQLAVDGITTPGEVLRVIGHLNDELSIGITSNAGDA